MNSIIKTKNLSLTYNNKKVVKDVTLSIKEGDFITIRGKSGSGKSSILSMLGGLERPSTGEVLIENKSLYSLHDKEQSFIRNKIMGFVFQSFHLIPELTAKENIMLPLYFSRTNIKHSQQRVTEIAKYLKIEHKLNDRPYTLSGGEQQRVAIVRAIIADPKVIFADEPTGNLDRYSSDAVETYLFHLNKIENKTIIVVTHDSHLFKHTQRSFWMEDGRLEDGSPS